MSTEDALMHMVEKMRIAEMRVSRKRGGFYLFGLFERESRPGTFDLVASAPWLKTDLAGTRELIDLLKPDLSIEDWRMVAAVFPLEPSAEYVRWFTKNHRLEHKAEEHTNHIFNGVSVSRAFLFTSDPSPEMVTPQPVAA